MSKFRKLFRSSKERATETSREVDPAESEPERQPESTEHGPDTENGSALSMRHRMGALLSEKIDEGLLKSKQKLEHALGLGQKPSAIPEGEVEIDGEPRIVEIGWHPVAGLAGKWFAQQTGLGKMITEGINKFPDPTQHWAVLVGDYCHQLWMDEKFDVIYINEKINRAEWTTYEVGKSRFNDEALKQAGEMTIFAMRGKRPAYNLIDNNCQIFALNMLDAISVGQHRTFATSYSVYQRVTGRGKIKDLFVENHPDEQPGTVRPETPPEGTVNLAQQVMDENTTKLDSHDTMKD